MKNTGKSYEKLTQYIFSQIVNQDQTNNIEVQHDVILKGKTTDHQIDVYWEFEVGGITYRNIIQAKDWTSKVKKSDMLAFKGIIDDLPFGTNGIYVSKAGYQSGALEVAEAHGIYAYELRPPVDSDWDGYIKVLNLKFQISMPHFDKVEFVVDKVWCKQNGIELPTSGEGKCSTALNILYDAMHAETGTLSALFHTKATQVPPEGQVVEHVFDTDTFVNLEGQFIKLNGVKAKVWRTVSNYEHKIDAGDFVGLILKNIVNGESTMFDKDNKLKKRDPAMGVN